MLKNKYISFEELQKLKEIEDALEKFYNSGRFVLSLKIIEKHFETPFGMYEFFAEQMKEKNLLFRSCSSKNLYDFLSGFFPEYSSDLLEDFYLSENSQIVPQSLKNLVPLNKYLQPASNRFLKENGFSKDKKVLAKFINSEALAIDYSEKNPVTGRYRILMRKEVSFDE